MVKNPSNFRANFECFRVKLVKSLQLKQTTTIPLYCIQMRLTEAKKKALRRTAVGNALYANEFREMMPVFKEVSLELALMSERLFTVATCNDPNFNSCEDIRRARDEVADRMIQLMNKWKTA